MDGSHFDTRYPVVLRFGGFCPENLAKSNGCAARAIPSGSGNQMNEGLSNE